MKHITQIDKVTITVEPKQILFDARRHQGCKPDANGFILGFIPCILMNEYRIEYMGFVHFMEAVQYCNQILLPAMPSDIRPVVKVSSILGVVLK